MIVWYIYFIYLMIFYLPNTQSKETNSGDGVYVADEIALKTRIAQIRHFLIPMSESHFQDILNKTAREYIPVQAVSEECRNHSNYLLESFMRGDMWALKMLDAGSKLVSGVLDGHLEDLGNYEQCISVQEPNLDFQGQHCVIKTWGVLPTQQDLYHNNEVTFSVCVPSSCSVEDVATHFDLVLAPLQASTLYSASLAAGVDPTLHPSFLDCSSAEPPPFQPKDYVATLVFSAITVVVLACTFLEPRYGSRYSTYSLRSNFHGLMNTTPSATEISCLNGLRVLMIILLVMYHRFLISFVVIPTFRWKIVLNELLQPSSTVLFLQTNTPLIDVFFMIGATVSCYSFLQNRQKDQAFNVFHFYIKRYFRLTPVLAVIMLFYATLMLHLSSGPIWAGRVKEFCEYPCNDYWWAGLLHVSNYYVSGMMCVPQSWYVACDFQFHLLAPLLLWPLYKKPRLGWILLTVCFFIPILTKFVYSYVNNLYPGSIYNSYINIQDTDASELDYRGIHFRAHGFVLGIALGYVLFMVKQKRENVKFSKPFFLFGWSFATVGLVTSGLLTDMVIRPEHEFSPWIDPLYNTLNKPVFCCCFAWIIFACSLGYGGFVNEFLSWRGFRPLAKLTFGVFLVHEAALIAQLASIQTPIAFTHLHFWCSLCGDMVVCFSLSAVLYLLVEIPFFTLALNILKGVGRSENIEKQMQIMSDNTIKIPIKKK